MADKNINMERFAYDVCVHVLEKFDVFKAPDDTRKQNKYLSYDFLPRISRSVVMYIILIRDSFKNALEDKYGSTDPVDKEKIWNFFDEYLLKNDEFKGRDCTGKMCMSLALCTEYIQFVSTKHFAVSINKIVIKWNDFFEKNLIQDFDAEGGFMKMHSNLDSSRVDQLDAYLKAFISEYLLPYGARECTVELAKTCAVSTGIPLDIVNFCIKTIGKEQCEAKDLKSSPSDLEESKTLKQEDISDPDDSRSTCTKVSDSETSQGSGSETSNSEILQNKLLGIPPHEEMLREIDPFFVENIPSPPKPQEHKSATREPQPSTSKSPEEGTIDLLPSTSKSPQPGTSDTQPSSSKSSEELTEMVEQILTKLEDDMDTLRALLFEYGLLSMKSGRRGNKRCKDSKSKKPPKGPEGLI